MEKSFREILKEFIQEEPTPTANEPLRTQTSIPLYEFPFTWQAPPPTPRGPAQTQARYPRPAPGPSPSSVKPVTKAKPELLLALQDLKAEDRPHVDTLIRLGAEELSQGVSTARLKRAYRRLAKKLHPDLSPGTALSFMELKKAYAALSASGCGSESASASKNRHPNAA